MKIMHWFDGAVLWEGECDNIRDELEAAAKVGANLQYAKLQSANLQAADLQSANLQYAKLQYADLQSAKLQYANLQYADLQAAKLQAANLQAANGLNPNAVCPLRILLEQPGAIRAYKIVTADGYGIYRGPNDRGICYEVGKSYDVPDAGTDINNLCDCPGLYVATLDWCIREWQEGRKILVVEFRADDIAAIPTTTDGKFRLHRMMVVGEKDLAEIGLVE